MHEERYDVPASAAASIDDARREGRTVLAVGTTVVARARVGRRRDRRRGARPAPAARRSSSGRRIASRSSDALLTNFHLPRSTLLVLVMAFGGVELVRAAYDEAVRERLSLLQLRRRDADRLRQAMSDALRQPRRPAPALRGARARRRRAHRHAHDRARRRSRRRASCRSARTARSRRSRRTRSPRRARASCSPTRTTCALRPGPETRRALGGLHALHGVAVRDPHRQRRLPGVHAREAPHDRRRTASRSAPTSTARRGG